VVITKARTFQQRKLIALHNQNIKPVTKDNFSLLYSVCAVSAVTGSTGQNKRKKRYLEWLIAAVVVVAAAVVVAQSDCTLKIECKPKINDNYAPYTSSLT